MGYRRNGKRAHQERKRWAAFLASNARLIQPSGLTEPVLRSEDRFLDFLGHGWIDHHDDPSGAAVQELSEGQYQGLVALTEAYMSQFGGNVSLMALRSEDAGRLRRVSDESADDPDAERPTDD